ncbi:MAG: MarR family winged helix-turn-helix transcriptional regulator [Pseudolabrys sp.]
MTAAVTPKPRQTAASLGKQRLRLWIRIIRTARTIESEVRARLRVQFSVTLPQFDVMAALDRKQDGMTMTELSRFLMVSNGNVTGIIDRLVADRLVMRAPPVQDRRAIVVRLTAKGATRFTAMAKAHQGWVDKLLSDFGATEAEMMIGHLEGLASRIRNGGSRA